MFLFRATHGKVLAGSSSFASQTPTAAGRHIMSNPIRSSERYELTATSATSLNQAHRGQALYSLEGPEGVDALPPGSASDSTLVFMACLCTQWVVFGQFTTNGAGDVVRVEVAVRVQFIGVRRFAADGAGPHSCHCSLLRGALNRPASSERQLVSLGTQY